MRTNSIFIKNLIMIYDPMYEIDYCSEKNETEKTKTNEIIGNKVTHQPIKSLQQLQILLFFKKMWPTSRGFARNSVKLRGVSLSRPFSINVDPITRLVIPSAGESRISHAIGDTSNPLAVVTVDNLFRSTVNQYPTNMGLAADTQKLLLSWEDLETRVQVAARGLLALGISKGDRVGCWLPNLAEYFIMQYATSRIGAVLVTLNPAYREKEFIHAVNKVDCKVYDR
jgi:hypothetical protein